jgi:predicted RNA-binding Zn ribbon-like protein
LLIAVANTAHTERDEFADADSVRAWWHEPVLSDAVADVTVLRELRALIRSLALRNNGIEPDPVATPVLDTLDLRLFREGALDLRPSGEGDLVREIAARTVAALLRATGRPAWSRMKACRGEDCRWVFIDGSRNSSRRWCAMAECGNRAKIAAYRDRNSAARRVR